MVKPEHAKKRGIMTRKRAAQRMDLIRRENVQRHNMVTARNALKAQQVAAQRVATMQQELDRLHAASVHGTGLDPLRMNRMGELRQIIGQYKNVNAGTRPQAPL